MSLGKLLVAAFLAEGSVSAFLENGDMAPMLKASEVDVHDFVRGFVKEYGKFPTLPTIKAHTDEDLPEASEPSGYYYDLLKARHTELELKKGMKAANDFLQPDNKDADKALEILTQTAMSLIGHKFSKQVIDFRQAHDLLMADYTSKWHHDGTYGLQMGWPTLDKMTGGLVRGDLLSLVGRPAAGKSLFMLYGALHGWVKAATKDAAKDEDDNLADQSRLFVSMEMSPMAIMQRLAAITAKIPAGQLKHASLSTVSLKKLKNSLHEIKGFPFPFYVVDGNLTATVEDIWLLARQLKPAGIFVDGGYLVKHPTERDRFRRVAENADLMKSELTPLAPTAVSWQFAKTAAKKNLKKGESPTLDDIGYTDAIAQVSSVALGILQPDTVDTLASRRIDILKGRSGEVGSFVTDWNWQSMSFGEIVATALEELQVV